MASSSSRAKKSTNTPTNVVNVTWPNSKMRWRFSGRKYMPANACNTNQNSGTKANPNWYRPSAAMSAASSASACSNITFRYTNRTVHEAAPANQSDTT